MFGIISSPLDEQKPICTYYIFILNYKCIFRKLKLKNYLIFNVDYISEIIIKMNCQGEQSL